MTSVSLALRCNAGNEQINALIRQLLSIARLPWREWLMAPPPLGN